MIIKIVFLFWKMIFLIKALCVLFDSQSLLGVGESDQTETNKLLEDFCDFVEIKYRFYIDSFL